jgi:acetyl-CoA carboxylase carboxyl transferase subunit alpha
LPQNLIMNYLDFEKPIEELENQLIKLKEVQEKSKVDLSASIQDLENKIQEKIKEIYDNLTPWQTVQVSRHPNRPYTLQYIEYLTGGNFMEFHGDRLVADDKAIVGGFGLLNGQTIMFIGHQKGINTKMRQLRRFGMANPDGYRKALRLMRLAEKFNKPIVTFIDTPGAYPGLEAEERGQGEAIARNIQEMFSLRVPVICIIIGEGASGGALGIGVGDKVYMLQYTWYSVISPESCSSILWRGWQHKEKAAEALKLTAKDMLELKLIDGIIPEPVGGAHRNPEKAAQFVKETILKSLSELSQMNPDERINKRIEKFTSMGVFKENPESNLIDNLS